MGMGDMLGAMEPLAEEPVRFTFADAEFLDSQGVRAWSHMPAWVPATGEMAGMLQVSIRRALDRGLTFRPMAETARDTLAWFRSLPEERQQNLLAGIAPEREAEVLRAWHARAAG
jgi:2'-hydroxyisoflavone reductase